MNGLHQQLEAKRRQITADEALVAVGEHLYETHLTKERLPRLRDEAAHLETDIELGELAARRMFEALNAANTLSNKGRELALATTYLETAAWRLRRHLGEPSAPTVQAD